VALRRNTTAASGGDFCRADEVTGMPLVDPEPDLYVVPQTLLAKLLMCCIVLSPVRRVTLRPPG
jgi:hypothetical protein